MNERIHEKALSGVHLTTGAGKIPFLHAIPLSYKFQTEIAARQGIELYRLIATLC
jgi:hypothetical protein